MSKKAVKELMEAQSKLQEKLDQVGEFSIRVLGYILEVLEHLKRRVEESIDALEQKRSELYAREKEATALFYKMSKEIMCDITLSDEDIRRLQNGETLKMNFHRWTVRISKTQNSEE